MPILIVHVSAAEAIEVIRNAQTAGPQNLRRDLPAIFVPDRGRYRPWGIWRAPSSAVARRRAMPSAEAVWRAACSNGTFQVVLSPTMHPTGYDETGKLLKGDKTTFKDTANGVPGIELRVPLLFSEGSAQRPHRPQPLLSR